MAFSDLVNELPQIDQAADNLRRAAKIIRMVKAGVIEMKDSEGDPDRQLSLTQAQIVAIFGPKVSVANQLLTDTKPIVAALVTS